MIRETAIAKLASAPRAPGAAGVVETALIGSEPTTVEALLRPSPPTGRTGGAKSASMYLLVARRRTEERGADGGASGCRSLPAVDATNLTTLSRYSLRTWGSRNATGGGVQGQYWPVDRGEEW